jgi:hypothetical protein
MADTTLTRAIVQAQLDAAGKTLHESIAGLSEAELEAIQVTPEWSALDILRHIWVWGEISGRCLDDWHGSRDWILTFGGEDTFNVEMVAARAGAGLAIVLGGVVAAYQRYAATLTGCDEAQLAERAAAPWGDLVSRLELISIELEHDLEHIGQLVQARRNLAQES